MVCLDRFLAIDVKIREWIHCHEDDSTPSIDCTLVQESNS